MSDHERERRPAAGRGDEADRHPQPRSDSPEPRPEPRSAPSHRNSFGPSPTPSEGSQPREAESAIFTTSRQLRVHKSFETMRLKAALLRGIYSAGFTAPSAIQQRCIVPMVRGRDVVAQAQSGTGKTAMVAIVGLQLAAVEIPAVQVVLLAPTRELAVQTARNVERLGEFLPLQCHACVGGRKVGDDIRKLGGDGVHVVSGTPGRIYDMIQRGVLDTKKVRVFVIDEADEMFGLGFKEQVYDIYRYMPADAQVVLVSATLPQEVLQMSEKFMTDPITVLVKKDGLSLDGIRQFYVDVEQEEWKFDTLCDLYETLTITQAVIFCNSRKKVEWLAKKMTENNFAVVTMHGDMNQKDRDSVMDEFRKGKSRVLVATDVWSRGIDVQQVSLVINYDVPIREESYIHRIGRSGRFGRKGVAITFVTSTDTRSVRAIERFYTIRISELPANVDSYL